jgi:hypothetical protein
MEAWKVHSTNLGGLRLGLQICTVLPVPTLSAAQFLAANHITFSITGRISQVYNVKYEHGCVFWQKHP